MPTHLKRTARHQFLKEMNQTLPWDAMTACVRRNFLRINRGDHNQDINRMLRIYFVQYWFVISDSSLEDELYESPSIQAFCQIDVQRNMATDTQSIRCFRYAMEETDLGGDLLHMVKSYLRHQGG